MNRNFTVVGDGAVKTAMAGLDMGQDANIKRSSSFGKTNPPPMGQGQDTQPKKEGESPKPPEGQDK